MTNISTLNFAYTRKKPLFRELSLSLPDGNIYGLLGKNGAGKTTLLKIVAGLLFPQQGQTIIDGVASKYRRPETMKNIYFIPEEFHTPPVSAQTYINIYSSFYPSFDMDEMEMYLTEFEIETTDNLVTLSYGQKKKFLIAFGLASNCRMLILDEPTNGLDIPSKSQFRKLAAAALTEERTFIISTHQVRDMENLIDPVIIIEDGTIIFYETVEEITRKLAVTLTEEEPERGSALYQEKIPGGFAVISENQHAIESRIDLELLFNAVLQNRQRIGQIFNGGSTHE